MNTGDLEPDWMVGITDPDQVADFTTVEDWSFKAYRETGAGRVLVFEDTDPIVVPGADPWAVTVGHHWAAGETDIEGELWGVPVAVWPGGRPQAFTGATLKLIDYT
jgi:hypothetical protein